MTKKHIPAVLEIYTACSEPLLEALAGLPRDQLDWKPGPDSRSIGETARHLIRVDNWFLERMGFEPETTDPGETDAEDISATMRAVHAQVRGLLESQDDTDLARRYQGPDAKEHDTWGEVVVHMSQHYLYHLAQMIYLRRARDREWASPMKQWEKASYVLSDELAAIRGALGR